jgi:pimeloyl-ACP methyl ester carboxylesterase
MHVRFTVAVLGLSLLGGAGCSSFQLGTGLKPEEFRAHVLMFDARGEPRDPIVSSASGEHAYLGAEHTPGGAMKYESYDAYIDHILASITEHRQGLAGKPLRVVFFFHGGLNSRAQALGRAEEQIIRMKTEKPDVYPIFVNWQTSLPSSYWDHLKFVTKGQDTYRSGAVLLPIKAGNDAARAITEIIPNNYLYLRDVARRRTYIREGAVQAKGCSFDKLDFREGTKSPRTAGFLGQTRALIMYFVTKWWVAGLLDGGGTPAWASMLYTSDRLFYSDQEMHHDYRYMETDSTGSGDFSHFLRRLAPALHESEGDDVVLAAHSAGAVVANAVAALFGDSLPISTLVYMAPACTIDELMAGGRVTEFLRKNPQRQMYILTLHEVAELSEQWYGDITPRGTLLVWLDEFIQPKHSEFRGQMMGRARNLRLHAHLIPCDVQPRIHITAYSEQPPNKPDPQTHSAVGSIAYWDPEAWRPADPALRQICLTNDPQKLTDANAGDGKRPEQCVTRK